MIVPLTVNNMTLPRRGRRGVSGLAIMLVLSAFLMAGLTGFQMIEAKRLRAGEIHALSRWAKVQAHALHHWLHDHQERAGFRLPERGRARMVTTRTEIEMLAKYKPRWLSSPQGWRSQYVIGNPHGQINEVDGSPARAHGILVIRADKTSNDGVKVSKLCSRLALTPGSMARAERLASQVLGDIFGRPGCDGEDTGEAFAVFASALAGIDPNLVLRSPRSGFAPATMLTALDLNNLDLAVGEIGVRSVQSNVDLVGGTVKIDGAVSVSDAVAVDGGVIARTSKVAVKGVTSGVGHLTINGPERDAVSQPSHLVAREMTMKDALFVRGPGPVIRGGARGALVVEECLGC